MTKTKKLKAPYNTPPLSTILAAMDEDSQAMDDLIRFYQPYIRTLATRDLYDASGYTHSMKEGLKASLPMR